MLLWLGDVVVCGCFFFFAEGRGRDVRPAAHLLSFASPKERRQRKGDPQSASPFARWAKAATCDARIWGGAAELAAFFELSSNSCGKPDHEACVSFGTHAHPSSCASRRSQKGWGAGSGSAAAFAAAPGVGHALRAADRPKRSEANKAERSDGPCGAPIPSGRAEKRRAWGERVCRRTHAPRCLARRSCLSGAASQRQRSEFFGAPQGRASQVAPERSAGDTDSRVAFSLPTFFWRSKRK